MPRRSQRRLGCSVAGTSDALFRDRVEAVHGLERRRHLPLNDAEPFFVDLNHVTGSIEMRQHPIGDQAEIGVVAPDREGERLVREQFVGDDEGVAIAGLCVPF